MGHAVDEFVFENARDEAIVIEAVGQKVSMRPCSVRSDAIVGVPPDRPYALSARNEAGEVIYRTEIQADRTKVPKVREPIYLRIEGPRPDACPAAALSYNFTVWNHAEGNAQVWWQGEQIGTVAGKGNQTFGPLPGSWRDALEIIIRSDDGEETAARYFGFHTDYDLGRVAEISIAVPESWLAPTITPRP